MMGGYGCWGCMCSKSVIMTRVMQLIYQLVRKGIHATKRDVFYSDVKLFRKQEESDDVLNDIACLVGCTRTSLHVVASEKGVVVGDLTFTERGDVIDCSRMGIGGKAVPPLIQHVTNVRTGVGRNKGAKFILLVEKDAAFMRLSEDKFYEKYPCIIITAKGQPDVATRLFLRRLRTELNIPILALMDSDPHGLKILSVYMSGSKAMSYDSEMLTSPDIKWLGVRPSDLDRYDIPEQCRLEMTKSDMQVAQQLLKEPFIASRAEWTKELQLMVSSKEKAEIRALRIKLGHGREHVQVGRSIGVMHHTRLCTCTFEYV